IHWEEGSGLKRMALLVRVDGETKYRFVRMVAAGTKTATYTAPKAGTYGFYLFIPEGEDAPRTREDPPAAQLTVVVDTTPPVIELEYSGGTGMKALSLTWTVTDENLMDNTVKLEVRKVNQTTWVDKTMSAATKGSTTLLGEKDIAEFRLTA